MVQVETKPKEVVKGNINHAGRACLDHSACQMIWVED